MTLFLITAPSCSGKTTITNQVAGYDDWVECISHTTRPMRNGEVVGETYYFISDEDFQDMENNDEFAETVEYHGNSYGITKSEISEKLEECKHAYIIVDYNGFLQIKEQFPDAVGIFLYMDKEDCLANMLLRGDNMETAIERISTYHKELENSVSYEYVIKNVRNKKQFTVDIIRNIIRQYTKW